MFPPGVDHDKNSSDWVQTKADESLLIVAFRIFDREGHLIFEGNRRIREIYSVFLEVA